MGHEKERAPGEAGPEEGSPRPVRGERLRAEVDALGALGEERTRERPTGCSREESEREGSGS